MAKRRQIAEELVKEEKISLRIALRAMFLNKGTYYYASKKRDGRSRTLDDQLVNRLKGLSGYDLVYGYRKTTEKLKIYNHKKVYRHMKKLNMLQPKKIKKKKLTRLAVCCPVSSNIRWEGDLTYVWDGSKINYLFTIIDAYDKEPIGDYYGLRCRAEEAIHSLEEAVKTRFGSLEPVKDCRVVLRLDQGSQYISNKFRRRAKELGVKIEYCGINCPDDKPYIESFFSRYKCEEVYRNEYHSFTEAMLGWIQYKHWYKTGRIHQGLGWMTIPEFKNQRRVHLAGVFQSKNTGA